MPNVDLISLKNSSICQRREYNSITSSTLKFTVGYQDLTSSGVAFSISDSLSKKRAVRNRRSAPLLFLGTRNSRDVSFSPNAVLG